MATPTAPPVVAAPAGLTPKAQRAWDFLGAHMQRMAERRGGLRDYHCGTCGVYLFSYVPRIGLISTRCIECGERYAFTTDHP